VFIGAISSAGQLLFQALRSLTSSFQSPAAQQSSASTQNTSSQTTSPAASGGHGAMIAKIESAVTQALQASQSNASADPNQVIQNAITQVLNGTNATPAPAGADDNSVQATFAETLKQFGVDPQQFRQDLLSALQHVKGSATGTGTTSQFFPTGSLLNTIA
jgi:hypothetical protein